MRSNKYFLGFLIFATLATALIFSWFRYGHPYGGGDVGMPFYDPNSILSISKFVWWEVMAPGIVIPNSSISVPLQFVQAIFQNIGLSSWQIQAILFWIIIFGMGYGMFLVAHKIFGKEKFGLALLAGFFYELNPFMMIQVWHRFIQNTLFLAAALPFFYLFFKSWIKTGRYYYLLLFLISNLIAVNLYGALAFIVTVFIFLIFICGFEIFFPWKGFKNARLIIFRTFLAFIAWTIINIWWLLPVLKMEPTILSSHYSVEDSLSSLIGISWSSIIPYSFIGVNPFYIYQEADFGKIFNTYFFRFLPWLVLTFLLPGFVMALKNKKWFFWSLLAIVGVFLSKGPTSPFGYPYIFGFSHFLSLGVLRNPYEKLGILIFFSYAILVPLGVDFYLTVFRNKLKKVVKCLILILLILYLGIFAWPMWGGFLVGKYNKLAFIELPSSYIQANEYIATQASDGRILHLPLPPGEGVTYYWKYGYNGLDSSQLYFNSLPSISRGLNIEYVDDALSGLSGIFSFSNVSDSKIIELLGIFNVRIIVLHKDIEWRGGYLTNPSDLEKILNSKPFLEKKATFGDLLVYKLKDQYFFPKVRLSSNTQYITISKENSYWPWLVQQSSGDFLTPVNKQPDDNLLSQSTELLVIPYNTHLYIDRPVTKSDVVDKLPSTHILPGSILYPLITLKEKIQLLTTLITDRFVYQLNLAGKRLAESYKIKDNKINANITPALKFYQDLLPALRDGIIARKGGGLDGGVTDLESIFALHLEALKQIDLITTGSENVMVNKTRDELISMLRSVNLMPNFALKENSNLPKDNRIVSDINVPQAADYELLQASQNNLNIYPGNLERGNFQVDNNIISLVGTASASFVSYGFLNLSKGFHEISFNAEFSNNLANAQVIEKTGNVSSEGSGFNIISDTHKPGILDFNIQQVTNGGWYQVNFGSWIKLGDQFKMQLLQDSDLPDPSGQEDRLMSVNQIYGRDSYNNIWNLHSYRLYIRPTTTKAKIRFLVEPWDDCRTILVQKNLCKDKNVRFRFEHESSVALENIEIKRVLANPIFLRKVISDKQNFLRSDNIKFIHSDPVTYSGEINVTSPQFLIFSESFHPGWELKLNNGKEDYLPSHNYLANLYGNAWYIEKPGNYTFTLKFAPQKLVLEGIIISISGSLLMLIIFVFWKKNKNEN